jgi:hypothetical protein
MALKHAVPLTHQRANENSRSLARDKQFEETTVVIGTARGWQNMELLVRT